MEDGDGVFDGGPKQPSMEYESTHAGHFPSIADVGFVYLRGEVTMGCDIYGVCLRKFFCLDGFRCPYLECLLVVVECLLIVVECSLVVVKCLLVVVECLLVVVV